MFKNNIDHSLIGLLPAAGKSKRIQPLPCSKELLPIGFQFVGSEQDVMAMRPKSVSQYLLESMYHAGARKAYIVLNRQKWDIPAYYGPGALTGIDLAYVVTDYPYGAPFSLKQAFPFVLDSTILFGFPDIRFTPVDVYSRLLEKMTETNADLVLGLFRAIDPSKMDMVRLDRRGDIKAIDIKPATTSLTYTWIIAVWSPRFTEFMQAFLDDMEPLLVHERQLTTSGFDDEYYVGNVIQAALDTDLKIENVIFERGDYIDIGTPESLVAAMAQIATGEETK